MWQKIRSFFELNDELLGLLFTAIIVIGVGWVISLLIVRKLFPFINKKLDKDKHAAVAIVLNGFQRPLGLLVKIAVFCLAFIIIATWEPMGVNVRIVIFFQKLPILISKMFRIAAILCITWGLVASNKITSLLLRGANGKLDIKMSTGVTRFLAAIFNVIVIIISLGILLSELNYDVNGIIAGLGLGGLTIALAAKDTAANFFGGLVLVLDKPFEIGDWIACEGAEGTVEDISLRSTKVRIVSGALTIVPNALVSAQPLTNWTGNMEKRRADFLLQLVYETPRDKLKEYIDSIRTLLETDPEVITESVLVRFAEFGAYSLNIKVAFYTSLPGAADHLRIKERINFSIMDLAENHNVDFAYPTQAIYLP